MRLASDAGVPTVAPVIVPTATPTPPNLTLATMYQLDANGNGTSTVAPGGTVKYAITIANTGGTTASNVEFWWQGAGDDQHDGAQRAQLVRGLTQH